MKRLKTHLPVKRTDLTNIKNQPYHVLSRSLDFAEKKTANLCEKCKSCTKEMSRLKARLSLFKKPKVKAKDDKRPSQALDCSAGQI